jgi:serine/threonine protein kinase
MKPEDQQPPAAEPDDLTERDPLECLAAEYMELCRRGMRPSIEDYTRKHPELAEDIRALFPTIASLEQAKEASHGSPSGGPVRGDVPLERLGDYRLLRELGRGGMGIVYEAEQESLGRRVAIKVLPRHLQLEPKQVERFEREARTAARLHHTNIVPIFGVGACEGYHYIVMQRIGGVGLDEVFRQLAREQRRRRSEATETGGPRVRADDPGGDGGGTSTAGAGQPATSSTEATLPVTQTTVRSAEGTGNFTVSGCSGGQAAVPITTAMSAHDLDLLTAAREAIRAHHEATSTGSSGALGRSGAAWSDGSGCPSTSDEKADPGEKAIPNDQASALSAGTASDTDRTSNTGAASSRYEPTSAGSTDRPVPPRSAIYWHQLADLGQQAAEALDYAHREGTLHRDIKPANLMVDDDGRVWVTDFGLAKAVDQEGVTQPGDLVGTLRYMAPEQFGGQVDARSDVYSLGITLYELATLAPAFQGSARSTLVGAIMKAELAPPRQLQPHLPPDLETILRKATARHPEDRYAGAGALAEDLQRFLEDRPLLARPAGPGERLIRWTRRNPTMAALTGTAATLLLTVAVVAGVAWAMTSAANARTTRALTAEKQQRARAEETTNLALGALDTIFQELAPRRSVAFQTTAVSSETTDETDGETAYIPLQPVVDPATAGLLEHLLDFYAKLSDEEADDPLVRHRLADAHRRIGDIHQRLGDYEAAKLAYERAAVVLTDLAAIPNLAEQVALERAQLLNEMGTVWLAQDDIEQAEAAFEDALTCLKGYGPTREVQSQAAAEDEIESTLASNETPGSAAREHPEHVYERARALYLLSSTFRLPPPLLADGEPRGPLAAESRPSAGRPDRGLPGLGGREPRGRGDRERPERGSGAPPRRGDAEHGEPGDRGDGRLPGRAGHGPPLPGGLEPPGRGEMIPIPGELAPPPGALPLEPVRDNILRTFYLQEAVLLLRSLVDAHPEEPAYLRLLALCHRELPADSSGRAARGTEAIEILERLVAEHPNAAQYQRDLIETYIRPSPGARRGEGGDAPDDAERLAKAVAMADDLVRAHPHEPAYTLTLADALHHQALRMNDQQDAEAEPHFRRAIGLQDGLVEQFPNVQSYRATAVRYRLMLADWQLRAARLTDANSLVEEALNLLSEATSHAEAAQAQDETVRENDAPGYVLMLSSHAWHLKAEVLRRQGDEEGAERADHRARARRARWRGHGPEHPRP